MSPENSPEREPLEPTPDNLLGDALGQAEAEEAADSSQWRESAKNHLRTGAKGVGNIIQFAGLFIPRMVWGLLRFAKEAIVHKGKVGFKKAYDIGEWIFNPDAEKGGKK